MPVLGKYNFDHSVSCSQEKLGAYIHLTYRATSQKVWHKHGAPQLGRRLNQWTNMDYFLITGPCTLSSMWSIIRAWRGFCIDFFSGKIVITSAWAGGSSTRRAAAGRAGRAAHGRALASTPQKEFVLCWKRVVTGQKNVWPFIISTLIYQTIFCAVLCISMPASWVGKYQFLCNFPFIKCFSS